MSGSSRAALTRWSEPALSGVRGINLATLVRRMNNR
jgi:hypothetical protein